MIIPGYYSGKIEARRRREKLDIVIAFDVSKKNFSNVFMYERRRISRFAKERNVCKYMTCRRREKCFSCSCVFLPKYSWEFVRDTCLYDCVSMQDSFWHKTYLNPWYNWLCSQACLLANRGLAASPRAMYLYTFIIHEIVFYNTKHRLYMYIVNIVLWLWAQWCPPSNRV